MLTIDSKYEEVIAFFNKMIPFNLIPLEKCKCGRNPTEEDMFLGVVYGKEIDGSKYRLKDKHGKGITECLRCRQSKENYYYQENIQKACERINWDKFRRGKVKITDGFVTPGHALVEYKFPGHG
jgi:hypothetical protein